MTNEVSIVITDDGIDKTFIIKKAKGMAAFNLFMDITRVIEKAQGDAALIAQQFLHNCMQTGMKIKGVSSSAVDEAIRQHSSELMYFIFNAFFKELDENNRKAILEQILKHVIFKNGALDTPLTTGIASNIENIDLYVSDIATIFKLCLEFVRFNFGHFLPQPTPESSSVDSSVS